MFRFSNSLVQGLANPSYAGMLSNSVSGGMQSISDAFDTRRTNQGYDSIIAMLQQDPSNPQVQQSAMAVARQMGMDPKEVNALIQEQVQLQEQSAVRAQQQEQYEYQKSQRGAEETIRDETHARNQAKFELEKTIHQTNQENAEIERQRSQAIGLGIRLAGADEETQRKVLENVPEELTAQVLEGQQKALSLQKTVEDLRSSVGRNTPLPDEFLEHAAETYGMEDAVEGYRQRVRGGGAGVGKANQVFTDLYKQVAQEALVKGTDRAPKASTAKQDENARAIVDKLFQTEREGFSGWLQNLSVSAKEVAFGSSPQEDESLEEDYKEFLSQRIAQRMANERDFVATRENITKMAKEVQEDFANRLDLVNESRKSAGIPLDLSDEELVDLVVPQNPNLTREQVRDLLRERNLLKGGT